MEKDIILLALHRFQEIVANNRSQTYSPDLSSKMDRQLARLAIKKYQKTAKWRSQSPRSRSNENGAWT